MAFILRQDKRKKGIYLQMYENYWDKQLKQPRNKCIESFGYVDDLVSNEIPDPVAYYQNYVKQLNEKETAIRMKKHAQKHLQNKLNSTWDISCSAR